jgi:basic membrane protein A
VITTYYEGDMATAFSDIEWGAATAAEQLEAGADVVFTAAGDTGRGALIEVAQQGEDTEGQLYCIGVDTDQWQTAPQARGCLVSSAVKSIPAAVDEVIAQVADGEAPAGNYFGPVGLAPFHDFEDTISVALADELEQLATDLLSGTVSTGVGG